MIWRTAGGYLRNRHELGDTHDADLASLQAELKSDEQALSAPIVGNPSPTRFGNRVISLTTALRGYPGAPAWVVKWHAWAGKSNLDLSLTDVSYARICQR